MDKKLTPVCDGFARDEKGKIWATPCNFEKWWKSHCAKMESEGKGPTIFKKKHTPRGPLNVSKELFRVPPTKVAKRSSVRNRQSLTKSQFSVVKSTGNRLTKPSLIKRDDGSPLLNIDAAKGAVSKPEGFKLFSNHSANKNENSTDKTPVKAPITVNETTPPVDESYQAELEFLRLEAALASVKKTASDVSNAASPMTSVCTSLENTKMSGTDDNFDQDVLAIMQEHRQEMVELRRHVHVYIDNVLDDFQKKYEDRMIRIKQLGGKKTKQGVQRTFRTAAPSVKTENAASPAVGKKVGLRKTTLNKNLSRNSAQQCETPRRRATVDSQSEVFYTPKIDKIISNYASNAATKGISTKLKEQCLSLQS